MKTSEHVCEMERSQQQDFFQLFVCFITFLSEPQNLKWAWQIGLLSGLLLKMCFETFITQTQGKSCVMLWVVARLPSPSCNWFCQLWRSCILRKQNHRNGINGWRWHKGINWPNCVVVGLPFSSVYGSLQELRLDNSSIFDWTHSHNHAIHSFYLIYPSL